MQLSLQDYLDRAQVLHPCLCPRQVLGVRMARLACQYFGIDPAIQRKQLFVYMEIGRCVADGVIIVTGASPTNYLMKLLDYGKVAGTFVHLLSGEALRIYEHPNSRQNAVAMMETENKWEAQLAAYQIMPDELLFRWERVQLLEPLPEFHEKYSVICSQCQAKVHEHAHVWVNNIPLCKACADRSYYALTEPTSVGSF